MNVMFLIEQVCDFLFRDRKMESRYATMFLISERTKVINKIIDELLKYSREAIIDANLDRIPVPDISKSFVGPIETKGHFLATNGSTAYLSTVHRTGNAHMISGKTTVTLILNLGLEKLVVDFDQYEAKYMDIGPRGKMRVTVDQNSIYAVLSLKYNLVNCTQELVTLIIDHLDGIDVRMTGLDPFNWLLDDVVTWVASDFRGSIKSSIEVGLQQSIKQALTKYNICKYLPHIHHNSSI
ncbi:hypothetical protein LSTR_LSTR004470 [Laodelphax striatellus]|uniref:Lipid-binding serum glycoprotein N-terminal domain-containing protein n=1 Tax=Laodelphax striatellus TaxID=195883 RepID=A0A482XFP8_LAOST|nr:hypothetical protein LSTR_LSTR004470 [Laodelphax striatellus]